MLKIQIKKLDHGIDVPTPKYMSDHAAGMDLYAAVKEETIIPSGQWKLIPTGFAMAIPQGFEAQVRPRSGLALKQGVGILNTPGTVDADYRGEVGVILMNHSQKDLMIKRGDRIAQMIINKIERVVIEEVAELTETNRGSGGFGHTGV